jgi:hypothetical protein
MSLHKAIEHGKEHRKPHFIASSRYKLGWNHCPCERCVMNREHKDKRRRMKGVEPNGA